jgi:hypothetical protein
VACRTGCRGQTTPRDDTGWRRPAPRAVVRGLGLKEGEREGEDQAAPRMGAGGSAVRPRRILAVDRQTALGVSAATCRGSFYVRAAKCQRLRYPRSLSSAARPFTPPPSLCCESARGLRDVTERPPPQRSSRFGAHRLTCSRASFPQVSQPSLCRRAKSSR